MARRKTPAKSAKKKAAVRRSASKPPKRGQVSTDGSHLFAAVKARGPALGTVAGAMRKQLKAKEDAATCELINFIVRVRSHNAIANVHGSIVSLTLTPPHASVLCKRDSGG